MIQDLSSPRTITDQCTATTIYTTLPPTNGNSVSLGLTLDAFAFIVYCCVGVLPSIETVSLSSIAHTKRDQSGVWLFRWNTEVFSTFYCTVQYCAVILFSHYSTTVCCLQFNNLSQGRSSSTFPSS